MIGKRGGEDAGDDRHRLAEARGQHQREELRLVADFAERDHTCRNEEGFHGNRGVAPGVNPAWCRQSARVMRRAGEAPIRLRQRGGPVEL